MTNKLTYRIISNGDRFRAQRKILGFWLDLHFYPQSFFSPVLYRGQTWAQAVIDMHAERKMQSRHWREVSITVSKDEASLAL